MQLSEAQQRVRRESNRMKYDDAHARAYIHYLVVPAESRGRSLTTILTHTWRPATQTQHSGYIGYGAARLGAQVTRVGAELSFEPMFEVNCPTPSIANHQ